MTSHHGLNIRLVINLMILNREFSTYIASFAVFSSPLFAPYLINPNVITFYSIPIIALFGFIFYLFTITKHEITTPTAIIAFLLLSTPLLFTSNLLLFCYALTSTFLFAYLLTNRQLITAYRSFLIAITIIILISLYVWLGWNGNEALHFYGWALTTDMIQSKMNGPFANGNVLAIIIVCAWSICAFFWLNNSNRPQWLWLFILLFFWIFIISSMARGAWLAQFVILIWLLVELIRRKNMGKAAILLIVGLIAWSAGDALGKFNQPNIGGIQQQFEKSSQSGLTARVTLWQSVWEVYKENPLFGIGPSQLKAHYLSGQAKALENSPNINGLRNTDSAHNILLHLMAEFGIAGVMLWLVISTLILRLLWLYRIKLDSIRWPALASVLALWVQGHFNISLSEPFPLILFAFMLGISAKPLMRKRNLTIKKSWLLVASSIVMLFLVSGAIHTTKIWHEFGQWMHMDYKNPSKGKLAASLAQHEELLPYIVEFSIAELVHLPGKQKHIVEMRPLILKAISLNQRPRLYKELFYSYVIDNKLESACKVGEFIKKQNWKDEPNSKAYADACHGTAPDAFQL